MLLDEEPGFKRPEASAELRAQLAVPDAPARQATLRPRQVVRVFSEGVAVGYRIAHQGAGDLVGHVHPLVQVERQRVGALHTLHQVA